MAEPINPQDPEVLLAGLLQFGKSQDGAVECDLVVAIRDLKERVRAAEARAERLEKALRRSMVVLDDWLNMFAPRMCRPERVEEARKHIAKSGTVGYIAEIQEQNRAALAKGEAD